MDGTHNISSQLTLNSSSDSMTVMGSMTVNAITNWSKLIISDNANVTVGSTYNQTSSGASLLEIQNGATFDCRTMTTYQVFAGTVNQVGTGVILFPASELGFVDADGDPALGYSPGFDQVFVQVIDLDANTDATMRNAVNVEIESEVTGDIVLLSLDETTNTSGLFVNETGVATEENSIANNEDMTLQMTTGENVIVRYTDNEDVTDVLTAELQPDPVIWDNDSGDGNWGTAENWSNDLVPTQFDRVLFNATSTDVCLLNINGAEVIDIEFAAGYTGTFNGSFRTLNVQRNLSQAAGSLDFATVNLGGDLIRTGGDFAVDALTLSKVGTPLTTFGAGTVSLGSLIIQTDTVVAVSENLALANSLTVNGTLNVTGDMTVSNFVTVNNAANLTVSGDMSLSSMSIASSGIVSFGGETTISGSPINNSSSSELSLGSDATIRTVSRQAGKFTIASGSTVVVENSFSQNFWECHDNRNDSE